MGTKRSFILNIRKTVEISKIHNEKFVESHDRQSPVGTRHIERIRITAYKMSVKRFRKDVTNSDVMSDDLTVPYVK